MAVEVWIMTHWIFTSSTYPDKMMRVLWFGKMPCASNSKMDDALTFKEGTIPLFRSIVHNGNPGPHPVNCKMQCPSRLGSPLKLHPHTQSKWEGWEGRVAIPSGRHRRRSGNLHRMHFPIFRLLLAAVEMKDRVFPRSQDWSATGCKQNVFVIAKQKEWIFLTWSIWSTEQQLTEEKPRVGAFFLLSFFESEQPASRKCKCFYSINFCPEHIWQLHPSVGMVEGNKELIWNNALSIR